MALIHYILHPLFWILNLFSSSLSSFFHVFLNVENLHLLDGARVCASEYETLKVETSDYFSHMHKCYGPFLTNFYVYVLLLAGTPVQGDTISLELSDPFHFRFCYLW
jgi:hypothetical protein